MATPPLFFNYDKTYCFVDIPAVGYAMNVSPWLFGFAGQKKKPDTALFLRNETQRSELENIIAQEAGKTTWNAILHGIGDNSRFYHPSAALLFGVCSAPFFCPLHIAAIAFIGVPFFAVPRYLQKSSVNKMRNWISDAPVYEAKVEPLVEYIAKEGVEEKIRSYATEQSKLGFTGQLKAVFKQPPELKKARKELANDFDELYKRSVRLVFDSTSAYFYAPRVAMDVYDFMRNSYEGRWLKHQKQVIFARPISCGHCEH